MQFSGIFAWDKIYDFGKTFVCKVRRRNIIQLQLSMAERRPMAQPNLCVHFFQSRKPQLLQKWSRNWSRRDEILTIYFVLHLLYFVRKRRKKYLPMSQYFWLIYGKLCGGTGFFNPLQEKNEVLRTSSFLYETTSKNFENESRIVFSSPRKVQRIFSISLKLKE